MFLGMTFTAIGLVLLTAALVAGVALWCHRCATDRNKEGPEGGPDQLASSPRTISDAKPDAASTPE